MAMHQLESDVKDDIIIMWKIILLLLNELYFLSLYVVF